MIENRKILIVDDEEQARLYLASIVSELYPLVQVRLASSPVEALFLLKKESVDLALLDVEMPGMTGLDLVQRLREISSEISIIFVSAFKRAEFIQLAIRLEAIDYLDKPVNPIEIRCALQKAFRAIEKNTHPKKSFKSNYERFCLLTDVGKMFVDVDEILYFTSFKRYSIATLIDGSTKMVRENLVSLSSKLPEEFFLRVSRQYIVNIKLVKYVSKSNKTISLQGFNSQIILTKIYPQIMTKFIHEFSL